MAKEKIYLKDYTAPSHEVLSLNLTFDIYEQHVEVTSISRFKGEPNGKLVLTGSDLELVSIKVNDVLLSSSEYKAYGDQIELFNLAEEFTLEIVTRIDPWNNHSGEGLYRSGDILCTQCEAEGFRRITYYLDRPDVMTVYTTKIIADKKIYPILLSNGDLVESGQVDSTKHYAIWKDPFKKPSYLFALVAGDLAKVSETYTTKSGRTVNLDFFVDHGNEDKCDHAIKSLQNSMKWDEDVFGLEYDLNTYMVVAVDSFNMGAMENKGLNIFNSAYVLAKKETATDADYIGIESVIGHEYFHNWTGNRVTCRDWFQLTLKEGLTVFRDQEFSADMLSRPVQRIGDVIRLKGHQFIEDAGPLSHPIKPKSFVEINNFYTSTIYEKGAEVIRMIHTILGKENFRKGMDLYFKRHDGQAVTTDDFVAAMSDASGINLEHFKVWYDQNGTPEITVEEEFSKSKYVCTLKQTSQTNNEEYKTLHIPLKYSLYQDNGEPLTQEPVLLEFKNDTIKIELDSKTLPVLSLNEGFSAPVKIINKNEENEIFLMKYCLDSFNQYNAAQNVIFEEIVRLNHLIEKGLNASVNPEVKEGFKSLLMNDKRDGAFKTMALAIPSLKEVNDKLDQFNFSSMGEAIELFEKEISEHVEDFCLEVLEMKSLDEDYKYGAEEISARSFSLFCLKLLSLTKKKEYFDVLRDTFYNSRNMTVEYESLALLLNKYPELSQKESEFFFNKWKDETLVVQKWLKLKAQLDTTSVKEIQKLESLDVYDNKIPNLVRSLLGSFVKFNFLNFHSADGTGYKFIYEKILELDKNNPQIAAGMTRALNFKSKLDDKRLSELKTHLSNLVRNEEISSDVKEIASLNLGK